MINWSRRRIIMKEINIEEIIEILAQHGSDNLKTFGAVMEILRRLGVECKAINEPPKSQAEKKEKEGELCIGFRH
jgi:hypothetical protein